jgi:hypothetical protein
MGKSTIVLVTLAALGLGALIGSSLVDEGEPVAADAAPTGATLTGAAPTGAVSTGGAPTFRFLSPDGVTVEHDEYGQAMPIAAGENFIASDRGLKTEILEITLGGDGATEYKAVMQQGDSISYSWSVAGGQVYYDFHAHDEAFGEEFFTRYAEGEGVNDAGTILAAYDGQHGWFWLNLEADPITITLEVMGFYDEIIEIDLGGY